ncbi:MAG TPA: ribonuclease HIII [Chthoniobacterales bacterium]|nr:ribonuclease HIII [Chthoniobacterales bacterium]
MPKLTTYTTPLNADQVGVLRELLVGQQFEFETKPYTIFTAKKGKLNIAVYEKGPKAVLQGKDLEDFITFTLEPFVLGEAKLGYDEVYEPEKFEPHFGIDESGKGDFFGPLVIAGAYVDADIARTLKEAGIQDSKNIGSDKRIRDLAAVIRRTRTPQTVIMIGPEKYNQLFAKFKNLNRLLAWGHARAIENLCELRPDCPRALSDKFADESLIKRALIDKGKLLKLEQRTKAESDYAVAAASILAREKFIDWLQKTGDDLGLTLPRGASAQVKATARTLVQGKGAEILGTIAKTHFKTASEVLGDAP